jgi:hypothetical protein
LTTTGTACNGPTNLRSRAKSASSSRARSKAVWLAAVTIEFSAESTAAMRSKCAPISASALVSPRAKALRTAPIVKSANAVRSGPE